MVKIRDLTEKQLLSQIEKYEKIYTQLLAEREKRVKNGADLESLKTSAEKAADKIKRENAIKEKAKAKVAEEVEDAQDAQEESTAAYQLKIDDSELSSLNGTDEYVAPEEEEEEEEEVRVTQLLQLSKEQLEELRGGAKDKDEKKEKKSLFGRKKKDK